jgi:hypothetical protein
MNFNLFFYTYSWGCPFNYSCSAPLRTDSCCSLLTSAGQRAVSVYYLYIYITPSSLSHVTCITLTSHVTTSWTRLHNAAPPPLSQRWGEMGAGLILRSPGTGWGGGGGYHPMFPDGRSTQHCPQRPHVHTWVLQGGFKKINIHLESKKCS